MEDKRDNSNIYLTPDDRKAYSETSEILIKQLDNSSFSENNQKRLTKKVLSDEDKEYKKKKRRFWTFLIISIIDIALFIYIIYLVISIFSNIA